ncbi:MAG: tol-pal system-associated acyl-CoA thioesterase [Gammaproteobacteria bacterium]|nr:tol-pal system-associated acyl-CoA thioesterase [Gammaproteobacteria bacterium]
MKPYTWQVRVYYEDTDAGGVVYYANYLRFMERARTEWLRALGVEQDRLMQDRNVLFAVRSVQIEYKRPARFNDALSVTVEPVATRPASLSIRQAIMHDQDEALLFAQADVNVVCLQADSFAPQPIPKDLLKEIERAC